MSPLVKKVLESLNQYCNEDALHVMDDDLIKVTFKALYNYIKGGEF